MIDKRVPFLLCFFDHSLAGALFVFLRGIVLTKRSVYEA